MSVKETPSGRARHAPHAKVATAEPSPRISPVWLAAAALMLAAVIWQPSMFLTFGALLLLLTGIFALAPYPKARQIALYATGVLFAFVLFGGVF